MPEDPGRIFERPYRCGRWCPVLAGDANTPPPGQPDDRIVLVDDAGDAALIERSDAPRRAAQLDATAIQNQEQADDELKATRDKAIEDQNDARAVKEREVEEARTAAEERKPAAAQRTASAEAAKRDEQAEVRAAEQKATAAAESKLDDAQAKRSDAASKRAQADQVETLANLEKQKGQPEQPNDA
jgi:hypothetical protein